MKLIEAKQAKEFASTFLEDKILQAAVNAVVDNAPGFELVRCGECWAYKQPDCPMNGSPGEVSVSDFCSYGERRTDV